MIACPVSVIVFVSHVIYKAFLLCLSSLQASTYILTVQALSDVLGDSSVGDPVSFNTSEAGEEWNI